VRTTLLIVVALLAPATARAGEAPPAATNFKAEYVRALGFYEKKLSGLLQAFPQEKLSWRPAEGVRSASEIFVHAAQAPKGLGALLTGQRPDFKKLAAHEKEVTDKAAIAEELKEGFAHARKLAEGLSDAELEETLKAPWGQTISKRFVLMIVSHHAAEHLGQLTVYARSNGVVPPWRMPKKEHKEHKEDATPKKE